MGGVEGVIDVAGRVMDRRIMYRRLWLGVVCVRLCSRMTCNYPGLRVELEGEELLS